MRSLPLPLFVSFAFVLAFGCSEASLTNAPTTTTPGTDGGGGSSGDGGTEPGDDGGSSGGEGGVPSSGKLRLMAANISSGSDSTYDPEETLRILQGLKPDVALVQELKFGDNSDAALQTFVQKAFGAGYTAFRETDASIPNAVVSRYPITQSGRWVDPQVGDRGFVYAKIAVPGTHPLWAVSVHLLTTGSGDRGQEAQALVAELGKVVQNGDYVVIGGDFNTTSRTESCIDTFGQILDTKGPYPADQKGNEATNAPRNEPYDWLLVDPKLAPKQVPTEIGTGKFAAGLVFDSRVYTPLTDVAPVMAGDSAAEMMQHMPVVRDFMLGE